MFIKINYKGNIGELNTNTNEVCLTGIVFPSILNAIEYIEKSKKEQEIIDDLLTNLFFF